MNKPEKKYQLKVGRRYIKNNRDGVKRLQKIINNWDYFALHWTEFYNKTGDKYIKLWNPKLKDVEYREYPSYILDYDYELRKIVPTMKKTLK